MIFQTARAEKEDIIDGLQAGAYYYLTKPFEEEALRSIVRAAVSERRDYQSLEESIQKHTDSLGLLSEGVFVYQTLEEARDLASVLARTCGESRGAVLGLSELMINAVEHGNTGITYADKTRLNRAGAWGAEVERRLQLEDYRDKVVTVLLEKGKGAIRITIEDEGLGFAWEDYLEMQPERAFDSHGRGIAMANGNCFQSLEYSGTGNKVTVMAACSREETARPSTLRHKGSRRAA